MAIIIVFVGISLIENLLIRLKTGTRLGLLKEMALNDT